MRTSEIIENLSSRIPYGLWLKNMADESSHLCRVLSIDKNGVCIAQSDDGTKFEFKIVKWDSVYKPYLHSYEHLSKEEQEMFHDLHKDLDTIDDVLYLKKWCRKNFVDNIGLIRDEFSVEMPDDIYCMAVEWRFKGRGD